MVVIFEGFSDVCHWFKIKVDPTTCMFYSLCMMDSSVFPLRVNLAIMPTILGFAYTFVLFTSDAHNGKGLENRCIQ